MGKWIEKFPWELWEVILEQLDIIDLLRCVTSWKLMITKLQGMSSLAELRAQVREAIQGAREEAYLLRIRMVVDHYIACLQYTLATTRSRILICCQKI